MKPDPKSFLKKKPELVQISIRIDEDLHGAIGRFSRAMQVSQNAFCEAALRFFVAHVNKPVEVKSK